MAQNVGAMKESIPRPRIQTLSDMIFGLALSIGAVSQLTQEPGSIVAITYSLLSFGFAFLILAVVWFRYSKVMSVLPVESTKVVAANMVLLFLVSAEPYLYNLMTISSPLPSTGQLDSAITTALYALDLGALMIILAFFTYELTLEDRHLIPRELMKAYRLTMYSTFIAAVIFIISALPIFWNIVIISSPHVPLRYFMWSGVFVANMGRRLDISMTKRRATAK